MAKKQKRESVDASIPIRVTQAKNASRMARSVAKAEDRISEVSKRDKSGDPTELEKLLGSGRKQDMSKFEQGNSRKRLLIRIALIVLGLFILAFAGFLYFTRGANKFGQNIIFSIQAPQTAASGEVLTLVVEYTNNETITLNEVELTMQFPEGFTFQSAIPSNTSPNTWVLGDIEAGAGAKITMKGQVVGDVGAIKNFTGTLVYTPSNFNYAFEEEASTLVTISTSALALEVDAPLRVAPEKEFDVEITSTNTSEESLENLQLLVVTPDGYSVESTDPETEDTEWKFDVIESKADEKVTLAGSLSGEVGEQKQFTVKIGFINQQGVFTPQTEKTFLVLLIKAGVTLEVDARVDGQDYAEWGDSIAYDVSYTNDGDIPLDNVEITLELDGETNAGVDAPIINWNDITSVDSGVVRESSIVWSPDAVDALKQLKPNDSGSFSVTIPLVDSPTGVAEGSKEFHILATAKAVSGGDDDSATVSTVSEIKIASQVELEADARYYSDSLEELGSGPIPPEVGIETTYRIFWRVSNTTNDVESVRVSAKLPSGVSWVGNGSISAGSPLTYNPQTREVAWSINRIPAGAGDAFPKLEASFTVGLTPTSDQEGEVPVLVGTSSLTSYDAFVGADENAETGVLTTDLTDDPQASGQGTVIVPSDS